MINNILSASSRTVRKILARLIKSEGLKCSVCGWTEGVGDLHHLNGKGAVDSDLDKNISYICCNCHRLAHENKLLKSKLVPFSEQVGTKWKKYYYNKKIT